MPYSAKAVANAFLDLASAGGKSLTPMKIQKLVFLAHGWHLAITGSPLLVEQIEAWKFGPVIRSLYAPLAIYGNQPITSKLTDFDFMEEDGGGSSIIPIERTLPRDNAEAARARQIIDRVWEVYGGYTAIQLSNLTHAPGSPWAIVFEQNGNSLPSKTVIPPDIIRQFYIDEARVRQKAG